MDVWGWIQANLLDSTLLMVFLIAVLGYLVGSIKVCGLDLGTAGILLVALVFGHLGVSVPGLVRDMGLVCFVTAVGFIAGPKFAFGRDKIGIPNRPAAAELIKKSKGNISIRWYNTGTEQYHTKLMYIAKPTGKSIITGGSTNFTQRNLADLNLENNLWIAAPKDHPLTRDLDRYFHRIWFNEGAAFSLEAEAYQGETTWMKNILFKLQKWLGFTTF